MQIDEIFERVLIESGQYLVTNEQHTLSQPDRFVFLIRSTLGTYSNYFPLDDKFNATSTGNTILFNDSSNAYGIPAWISSVVPLGGGSGSLPPSIQNILGVSNNSPYLNVKCPFSWRYRKPKLYLPYDGVFDIIAMYKHKVTETVTEDSATIYSVDTISHDSGTFFKLLTSKFLTALARNRRAFTLTPLEITSDADILIVEAEEMGRSAVENLHENHNKWYRAWR